MMFRTHKRAFAFAPLLAAVALMAACDDDPVEVEDDPADAVEIMRLTVGGEAIDLGGGDTEDRTIPLGEPTPVEATFLDADGVAVGGLGEEFELLLEPEDENDEDIVTWVRNASDPFAGTLTVDGDAVVSAQLFHIEEGHEDFEVLLNVTVE